MEKYYYTKALNNLVLAEAIKLRTTLRSVFMGCTYSEKANGTVADDNIELAFSRALTSTEQDEITAIVNQMGPSYDLVVRNVIEHGTMDWAIKQGQELIAKMGANNLYRQKTPDQVKALVTDYPDLLQSLLTGSLQTTYGIFAAMQPDDNITQEEIDEFTLRLGIILGL